MKILKISLDKKDFKLKLSFRALMEFERFTGKSANKMGDGVTDLLKMLYCSLKVNNKEGFNYKFDEFVDLIDDSPHIVEQFSTFVEEEAKEEAKEGK